MAQALGTVCSPGTSYRRACRPDYDHRGTAGRSRWLWRRCERCSGRDARERGRCDNGRLTLDATPQRSERGNHGDRGEQRQNCSPAHRAAVARRARWPRRALASPDESRAVPASGYGGRRVPEQPPRERRFRRCPGGYRIGHFHNRPPMPPRPAAVQDRPAGLERARPGHGHRIDPVREARALAGGKFRASLGADWVRGVKAA